MSQAAVIGSPISQSRSPAIFAFLAEWLGRAELRYAATEVRAAELGAFVARVRGEPSFVGFNVTIPHKESIISWLDEVGMDARAVGAVNVVQASQGRLIGHNTDVLGVARTLEEQGCRMRGEDAWLFGAGGAARAVAYVLGEAQARCVYVFNRDVARAAKLCDELGAFFPSTSFLVARGAEASQQPLQLVVNCTPVVGGAAPDPRFDAIQVLSFKRKALAFDLVYNPERTPFLEAASRQGLKTVNGLDMLVWQALATWEIWFGSIEDVGAVKSALIAHLRDHGDRPIFLTGFMGVGKSVVGANLAARLGWGFVDTDEQITLRAGMSVPQIFEARGEDGFRKLETQVVAELAGRARTVVSLGGGALTRPENLKAIEGAGKLVYLEADAESLRQRLRHTASNRPLLAGLSPGALDEKIRSLLESRKPVYERAALKIQTDGLHPGDVVEAILSGLHLKTGGTA